MHDKQLLKISDIQGLTKLIIDATLNVTNMAEDLNQQIIHPPHLPSSPIQHLISGISGLVYKGVRGTTKLVGRGITGGLAQLAPERSIGISLAQKETILSILNGVIGDYLNKEQNPLALPMQFKYQGKAIPLQSKAIEETYSKPSGKILLMIHGLCMDDLQWHRNGHNHGELLAKEFNLSPIYLRYNSGLHISENGQHFSNLLEEFVQNWPVPIEEITILAHSMGGLVTRSAYNYATLEQKTWTKNLKKIIFLGTPHQGAPLERVGNHVDLLLEAMPYTRPFAKLGKMRSAGITDLRLGILVEEDWKNLDRFENEIEQATLLPLPKTVDCYAVAASMESKTTETPLQQLGDGLVPIKSALGQHKNAAQSLQFKPTNTSILYKKNHLDLISSLEVYQKIKQYLTK
ncbi:MAG: pimeloyl-ACP methyl ester carboxylesterase [Aureispira sp.]|jgi:pimeloyl-ACP methyl ester carboxylesterase